MVDTQFKVKLKIGCAPTAPKVYYLKLLKNKAERIGRNPKTKEKKIISERKVILFKPSKEFKNYINNNE